MGKVSTEKDYSLVGANAARAVENGLAFAQWYQTKLPNGALKELMLRQDRRPLIDLALWLTLLVASGIAVVMTWGTWWVVLPLIVYGTLYGSAADARWHECGHNTAFKSKWLNQAVYQMACFMLLREPLVWKRSHTRHHLDTIIVGRDREIVAPRPPDFLAIFLGFFSIGHVIAALKSIGRHAVGRFSAEERSFIPEHDFASITRTARIWIALLAAIIVACVITGSILPAVLVGLPTMYGAWLMLLLGLTQHVGLAEDVLDYRLNTRTIFLNPILRFLYLNMNYHLEHHMFPSVPYYNLPKLHALIKHDCPPPYHGLFAVYKEMIPTLLQQRKDPGFFIMRNLPDSAQAIN